MDLRRLDLADDSALTDAYAVECAATQHVRRGWVPMSSGARLLSWRADDGWRRLLVGAFQGDRLVGFATSLTAHDTPATSWLSVAVLPEQQRRGIGSRLVRAAERSSPDDATRFVASAYRRTPAEIEVLVAGFAEPLGFERATTETVVELDLGAAELTPVPPAEGYTVATFVDGVPEPLRARVGVLKGLVDAEAPSGALEWQPAPVPVEEYVAEIALWQRQGRTAIETVALDHLGDVAAWTCVVAAHATTGRPAQTEGTLVLTPHRGRRLGTTVKSANLAAARARGVLRVRTSSDDQNVWMRAINEQLGFVPIESEVVLHRRRA